MGYLLAQPQNGTTPHLVLGCDARFSGTNKSFVFLFFSVFDFSALIFLFDCFVLGFRVRIFGGTDAWRYG